MKLCLSMEKLEKLRKLVAEWRVRKGSKKKESMLPIAAQILLK